MADTYPRYIPITDWTEIHRWPSYGQWQYLIRVAERDEDTAFLACVRKIGRRWIVCEDDWFAYLESKREGEAPTPAPQSAPPSDYEGEAIW